MSRVELNVSSFPSKTLFQCQMEIKTENFQEVNESFKLSPGFYDLQDKALAQIKTVC